MTRFHWLCLALSVAVLAQAGDVAFEKTVVDTTFRGEGVATGDVNHDGKTDIITGDVWYAAPDWKMHEIRPVKQYKAKGGYSECFQNFAQDVNGDGWVDSIVVVFPGRECAWYENPQNKPGHWKKRIISKSCCGETVIYADLLSDGKPVLCYGVQPEGVVAWFSVPKDLEKPWDMHPMSKPKSHSTQRFTHGYGVGDVNGDGRNDFLCTKGWWEAPEDRTATPWTFHAVDLGPNCADMIVYDVDADGDNDIFSSSAHAFGIWWHEQTEPGKFVRKEIFKKYSQVHALILADMNGDGIQDLVTGKRHYAHNGHDPDGEGPAMLYWFEVQRPAKGKVEFVLHEIDNASGVGTQFEVSDFNKDKKPDIIISNKSGVFLFLQK